MHNNICQISYSIYNYVYANVDTEFDLLASVLLSMEKTFAKKKIHEVT